jgi:hypothetical protein
MEAPGLSLYIAIGLFQLLFYLLGLVTSFSVSLTA